MEVPNPRECPACGEKKLYGDFKYDTGISIYDCSGCDFGGKEEGELGDELAKLHGTDTRWDEDGNIVC